MGTAFLSGLLREYGRPRASYAGKGELASDNDVAAVEWAAAQYDDGQILLACQSDASAFGVLFSGPRSFTGANSDGITFTCGKQLGELPLLGNPPDGETGGWAVYQLSMLHANFPASGPAGLVRHLLTNFEFDPPARNSLTLHLPDVEGEVQLSPEPKDLLASQRLRALRSARPTAWLEPTPQQGQAVAARKIANNICNLLSIARGTKVSWIQEEILNTDGARTHLVHSNRVTKPFTPFAPIDPHRIRGTRQFLEATYAAYRDRRDRYRLDRGTIDAMLDAKVETDFLETRGANLAIALETLKHNVLVAADPDVEFYTSPEVFTQSLNEIADCARKVLLRNGFTKRVAGAITAPPRFRSLNRRSFAALLRATCKKIDLRLSNDDLQLFVHCRNSLVHRGGFYFETASPEERTEVPPKATKLEEYLFLISVVDAFLLRLVDYRGPYLVRTGGPGWEERHV